MNYVILLIVGISAVSVDLNTFSNYQQVTLNHLHLEWLLDLDRKVINATAEYDFTPKERISEILLDIYKLNVQAVYNSDNGRVFPHTIEVDPEQTDTQGDTLRIRLTEWKSPQDTIKLRIKYFIDSNARAISILDKSQTDDKLAPYLFSQCEANNCRSMIPLQDTPSVKFTYSATIITIDPLINVFMSGLSVDQGRPLMGSYSKIAKVFNFRLDIKIPAYLIAIVAGTVQERRTKPGSITYVISEAKNIQKYATEFEDLDTYVTALEQYIGVYKWKLYKIVILPFSFPFGGMENPLLTFASPTIVTGTKSGISVAVHEIAHSWFGNTVTCNNWSNMWINEGFCVFLERKGLKTIYNLDHVKIDALNGQASMLQAMKDLAPVNPSYASIHPLTEGKNPDDSFSTIPYEKGFQLLYYLELQIGETLFQQLLQEWLKKYEYKSADAEDFYAFVIQFIRPRQDYLTVKAAIDLYYKTWVYEPGPPPYQHNFQTQAYTDAITLADEWLATNRVPEDYEQFFGFAQNQKYLFLQRLYDSQYPENINQIVALMDVQYTLSDDNDAEIKYRWYKVLIKSRYIYTNQQLLDKVEAFVGSIGRMKMINPIYSTIDIEIALEWFEKYYNFYHPIARVSIQNILNQRTIE